jgi:hypothetical protein
LLVLFFVVIVVPVYFGISGFSGLSGIPGFI